MPGETVILFLLNKPGIYLVGFLSAIVVCLAQGKLYAHICHGIYIFLLESIHNYSFFCVCVRARACARGGGGGYVRTCTRKLV
jgi:hypothetical protein